MKHTKDPDSIFLTRGGYLPNYGDVVITKRLGGSVTRRDSLNSIPEEYTTRRQLSLRNNARIYVPDDTVDDWKGRFADVRFYPKSLLPIPEYGLSDRISALGEKLKARFVKTSGDAAYRKMFGSNARLVGSEALGINVPGSSDTDVFIPYQRESYYQNALERIPSKYPGLQMNAVSVDRPDKKTFTGVVNGAPMDVVVAYGPRAQKFSEAFSSAKQVLDESRKQQIIAEKQRLKNAWLFPGLRHKWYKRQVADELGLRKAYF